MLVDAREGVEDCEGLESSGFWLAESGKRGTMGLFCMCISIAHKILGLIVAIKSIV